MRVYIDAETGERVYSIPGHPQKKGGDVLGAGKTNLVEVALVKRSVPFDPDNPWEPHTANPSSHTTAVGLYDFTTTTAAITLVSLAAETGTTSEALGTGTVTIEQFELATTGTAVNNMFPTPSAAPAPQFAYPVLEIEIVPDGETFDITYQEKVKMVDAQL